MADDELTAAAAERRPVEMRMDPMRANFISCFGKKGHGKSTLARRLFDVYPYDRAVIDWHRDVVAGPGRPADLVDLHPPLPDKWPTAGAGVHLPGLDKHRSTIAFSPDSGRADYIDDMDRFVGLAYRHGSDLPARPAFLWIDEIGELAPVGQTQPNMRRMLQLGRHRRITLVMCGPRPINVDPLVLQQSDYVFIFTLPNPADRRRVADTIGWDPREFDDAVLGLPKYGYLRYDGDELVEFPPLPRGGSGARGSSSSERSSSTSLAAPSMTSDVSGSTSFQT